MIVASIARLMRFRLVEVVLGEGGPALRASAFGLASVTGGHPLPVQEVLHVFFRTQHVEEMKTLEDESDTVTADLVFVFFAERGDILPEKFKSTFLWCFDKSEQIEQGGFS